MRVLAGDIGGTHARLAVVSVHGRGWRVEVEHRYRTAQFHGLAPLVREFRDGLDRLPERASLGVAAPVRHGRGEMPNLGWRFSTDELRDATGIPDTRLINDFDAVGHAIPLLGDRDVAVVQPGADHPDRPIAVIGAGTGLGEALLVPDGDGWRVLPSEGGHVDFAPNSALESRLWAHLHARYGHVSWERVVSGPGLVETYRFLAADGVAVEDPATRAAMKDQDPAAVISERGQTGKDPLATTALRLFVAAFGAQAGNLALTVRAGAVYLAGGIAPQMLGVLREPVFLEPFRAKGRVADVLVDVPVRVIVTPDAGLIGAAAAALRPARNE